MVSARRLQHSPMFGQLADSQTVQLLSVNELAHLKKVCPDGRRALIQAG